MNLWAIARFDPDPVLRRRILVGCVDYLRRVIVAHLERPALGTTRGVPAHALKPFEAYSIHPQINRLALIAYDGPPEAREEAERRHATHRLAELAENAAKVGLLVTDEAVVDLDEAA